MAHRGITSFLRHDAPDGGPASLAQALDGRVREGELVERRPDGAVRCFACGHRCLVKPGRRGICKVRFNKDGALQVPAGYVAALQCDPTEKKPFFHALPGSDTLTFGMLGCDFHCGYCQNWLTSQALRDDAAGVLPTDVTPDALVRLALGQGAKLVGSSYNEPLITAEWAVDVFKVARAEGLKTAFISNGNATPEVLDYIRPWTDCYKIDLKAMDDKRYRELGGVLQHATQLAVAFIVHRLEVDLVAVGPRADVVEDLGGGVAVRDERRLQPLGPGHLEDVHRPLGRDERLVVGGADELRPLPERQAHQRVRSDVGREHARGVVAQRLRREPVLAVTAMEITAQHAERQGVRAGERVEERLFLSGIALQGGHVAGRHLQRPILVEAHLAEAPAPGLHETAVAAGEAAHRAVGPPLDQLAFAHPPVQRLRQRRRPTVGRVVPQEGGDTAVRHVPPALSSIYSPSRGEAGQRIEPGARS